MTLAGRGQSLSGGQRSSAAVFGCFSPSGQTLLAETTFGLMAVMVSVRQAWLRQHHPTDSIPMIVTHTMGGFARDVARRFSLALQIYSHIAHMEALLRADRFFGVSLVLLQQTEASFLDAFILAGGVLNTFELFTHEWISNPARVAAAQEARRLADIASAAVNDTRADELGLFSRATGRPDGFGMNIAGGSQKVQEDAADLGISHQDKVETDRYLVALHGSEANALTHRGQRNPKLGTTSRNEAVRLLGEEVGSAVMGPENWALYFETSIKKMLPLDKPFSYPVNAKLVRDRISGERDGWVLHHAAVTKPRWSMTDKITYRLPSHTEEDPAEYTETVRDAISDAYHHNWNLHSRLVRRDKKDKDAGKPLPR